MLPNRLIYSLVLVTCIVLLAFGLYLQYVQELEPCPLCMVQRVFFALLGLTALVAALHNPGKLGVRIYSMLLVLFAGCGGAVASRQVWLQHLPPDQVPECAPGLAYMLEVYPLAETITTVLQGTGDCAEVLWRFLGFSIPEWALLVFTIIVAIGVIQIWKSATIKKSVTA